MTEARAETGGPREPGFPWLLVVFFLAFAGILLIATQRTVDPARPPAFPTLRERPEDHGKGASLDAGVAPGPSTVAPESARLVARGQVLDDLRARPVPGVRVVLTLRSPLEGSSPAKSARD